jgi:hypothetical protein
LGGANVIVRWRNWRAIESYRAGLDARDEDVTAGIVETGDVREGLAEALAYKDGPVVVDAVVDPFALSLPSHVPFHTVTGFTLSMAKQVLSGKMDSVIKTIERNIKLV